MAGPRGEPPGRGVLSPMMVRLALTAAPGPALLPFFCCAAAAPAEVSAAPAAAWAEVLD